MISSLDEHSLGFIFVRSGDVANSELNVTQNIENEKRPEGEKKGLHWESREAFIERGRDTDAERERDTDAERERCLSQVGNAHSKVIPWKFLN